MPEPSLVELRERAAPQAPAAPTDESAKRRQILDGARAVFMARGFDGASMNDVAREAGVSKGTLYVYFASKEALFEALIRQDKQTQAERLCDFDPALPLEAALFRFGEAVMTAMARPASIAQIRTVIGVTSKFPQIGRAFYEAGPEYGAARLAAYLDGQTAAGRLVIADTRAAATLFLDLCKSGLFARLVFGVVETVAADEIAANVGRAVEVFRATFAVGPERPARTDSRSGSA
ncbi:MAG: TetR/AcrR family transcriptional regulator [Rhizobiales bacterium]|nr:TetR/AcrR family transcriptional regulator [Hyphomicrobiales bacterium]